MSKHMGVAGRIAASLPEALRLARAAAGAHASPVVGCGSLYLVGEARALLRIPTAGADWHPVTRRAMVLRGEGHPRQLRTDPPDHHDRTVLAL